MSLKLIINTIRIFTSTSSINLHHIPAPVSPCDDVMCAMWCEHGFQKDDRGCDICFCKDGGDTGVIAPTTLPSTCSLPYDIGPCRANHERYYFNSDSGNCEIFFYGGCQGNLNNFESIEGCESECVRDAPTVDCSKRPICFMMCAHGFQKGEDGCDICSCNEAPITTAPPDHVCPMIMCRHSCPVDYETDSNGCQTCRCPVAPTTTLPTTVMPCPMVTCLYDCPVSYEKDSNGCETCRCPVPRTTRPTTVACPMVTCRFSCPVNYERESNGCPTCRCPVSTTTRPTTVPCPMITCRYDCPVNYERDSNGCQTCRCPIVSTTRAIMLPTTPPVISVCQQPMEIGPCKAIMPRWYYNQQSGVCEEFNYGGCRGNGNNFEQEEQCTTACARPLPTTPPVDCSLRKQCRMFCEFGFKKGSDGCDICECNAESGRCNLPSDSGPCEALMRRWFFNSNTRTCEMFNYGGCEGNENNFADRHACEAVCLSAPIRTTGRPPVTDAGGCSLAMCMMFCEHGWEYDDKGCPLCACAAPPTSGPCAVRHFFTITIYLLYQYIF